MNEIPLKGNIQEVKLPHLLASLNRQRKTGTLMITTPVFTKKVFLVKGDAIFASSSFEDDRLGEMLIKAGKITMEQYDKSVEMLKKTGKRQGAILVELGYLTPKDLFWGVKYQVREIIYSLFQLQQAEFEFIEDEIPEHEVITLKMSMGNLIYEGVKRIDNWTRIKQEMTDSEAVLKLSHDPVAIFQDIELSPQDRQMLSFVDGKMTTKQLIDSSLVGSFEAMKILYVLLSIGVLEVKAQETTDTRSTMSHEEVLQPLAEEDGLSGDRVDRLYYSIGSLGDRDLLEVGKDDDTDVITKNYYRLSREFHPDRYFSSDDPMMKDKLTAIFDAITAAYKRLLQPEKDEPPQAPVQEAPKTVSPSQDAEQIFRNAVDEFKGKRFERAIELLRQAVRSDPKKAKYWSSLALSYTKVPDGLKNAEEALLEAIKIEPANADHYVNLGTVSLLSGRKNEAYSYYEKALALDPGNIKAKKGLQKAG
jgi:tetratricopeptide (TPR) repeat protein